jgi:hypothetical protein
VKFLFKLERLGKRVLEMNTYYGLSMSMNYVRNFSVFSAGVRSVSDKAIEIISSSLSI